MAKSLFPVEDHNALYFSRTDPQEIFGTFSDHAFQLEDKVWPSVEHYFQAMKFESPEQQEKIRSAGSPGQARKLGRSRFKRIRRDWKQVKHIYMTRALYTKCRAHPAIGEKLLATGDTRLVENSVYDYYWGCGRDRRGDNRYGEVLMNVRKKLREELAER